MKQIAELLDTGIYNTFTPTTTMIVSELMSELKIDLKTFGILVNGKKARPEDSIHPDDTIVILPHIQGGY